MCIFGLHCFVDCIMSEVVRNANEPVPQTLLFAFGWGLGSSAFGNFFWRIGK